MTEMARAKAYVKAKRKLLLEGAGSGRGSWKEAGFPQQGSPCSPRSQGAGPLELHPTALALSANTGQGGLLPDRHPRRCTVRVGARGWCDAQAWSL